MANYAKGIDTQKIILESARKSFYKNGYHASTTRSIAQDAGINLGLIKYYFSSKAELAKHIYMDIREDHQEMLAQKNYSDLELMILSSAAELKLCFEDEHFCLFYHEIYQEPSIRKNFKTHVMNCMSQFIESPDTYSVLASCCLTNIKPALVSQHLSAGKNSFPPETFIRFYMEQQLYYYKVENITEQCNKMIAELNKYYFSIDEMFFSHCGEK